MKRLLASAILSLGLAFSMLSGAWATPSTQIWIPSTDIQPTGTWHLGLDSYVTGATGTVFYDDWGLTYGLFPGLEIGVDYIVPQSFPVQFNIKYGITESKDFPFSFAVGAYNLGFTSTTTTVAGNDQNIIYGLIAKNIDVIGRISAGYYSGNSKHSSFNPAVLAPNGKAKDSSGLLLSWDKQLNDKWWAAVDYQGGNNDFGALSFGVSYAFSSNTSVIFGYDIFNAQPLAPALSNNAITTQLDINF